MTAVSYRLASVLALLLAFAGASAGSARTVESTRLIAAISWQRPDDRVSKVESGRVAWPPISRQQVIAHPAEPCDLRTRALPHQLFQRPPPRA